MKNGNVKFDTRTLGFNLIVLSLENVTLIEKSRIWCSHA